LFDREQIEAHLQRIAFMEYVDSLVGFCQAPLTLFMIQRCKFQQRTNFEPRKGFEMICKIKEAAK
jgi:hypothetical protein